ncbi:MAG: hypothetical protein IJT62_00415 [Oscillospiraceae bacterium]|nr:hypothetical protein [Oscillospiraceae bacterium]
MKREIRILNTPQDAAALEPVLEQLRAKGFRTAEAGESTRRSDVVLAVLSENFYADGEAVNRLLGLLGDGAENVLPLQLDAAPVPDELKNALYARNIIPAAGRESALIAERIAAALPKKNNRLPLILTAGALVLAVLAGLLIWLSVRNKNVPAMAGNVVSGISIPQGLTEEDLSEILYVYFIADGFYHYTEDEIENFRFMATYNMEDDGMRWYSTDDGHELSMTTRTPEDLEFLTLMPNLRGVDFVLTDVERLPDLSGQKDLEFLEMADCTIRDISGLSGSAVQYFHLFRCPVQDYSVLNDCPRLEEVRMEFEFMGRADLSGFSPPNLLHATFEHGRGVDVDLSGLAGCPKLQQLIISYLPVSDLSFLSGTPELTYLHLQDLEGLRDISGVGTLQKLTELEISECPTVTDYSPIGGCSSLEKLDLNVDQAALDVSFFSGLPKLRDITLTAGYLPDMEFLRDMAGHAQNVRLDFAGRAGDYSGLEAIGKYEFLCLNINSGGGRYADLSGLWPYLTEAEVDELQLHWCRLDDLSLLPKMNETLDLRHCELTDLSTLPAWGIKNLSLEDLPYLNSLQGLDNLTLFTRGGGNIALTIQSCPRLTDWSVIEGKPVHTLHLRDLYSLPALDTVDAEFLELAECHGLTDLRFLDSRAGEKYREINISGQEEIADLSPLRNVHVNKLTVGPNLAEQAEDLLSEGCIEEYEIAYPQGSWELNRDPIELLSLDELQTLPKALLRRVERLCVAGDTVFDPDGGEPQAYEEGILTELGALRDLTGLRELWLRDQPLRSLDGIQSMEALETLTVQNAPELGDISAVFTLQQLRELSVQDCPAESLSGIENLSELVFLDVSGTGIKDLTPLLELDRLEEVWVSPDMSEAVASLEGKEYGFRLEGAYG